MSESERRQFSRIHFVKNAYIKTPHQHYKCSLLDISLHGALITKPNEWRSFDDDDLCLCIELAQEQPEISVTVKVIHHMPDALGLCYIDIDVDSMAHLRKIIELNLGDAELLQRNLSALCEGYIPVSNEDS